MKYSKDDDSRPEHKPLEFKLGLKGLDLKMTNCPEVKEAIARAIIYLSIAISISLIVYSIAPNGLI